jgi:hypothetical protein
MLFDKARAAASARGIVRMLLNVVKQIVRLSIGECC